MAAVEVSESPEPELVKKIEKPIVAPLQLPVSQPPPKKTSPWDQPLQEFNMIEDIESIHGSEQEAEEEEYSQVRDIID